MQKRFEQDTGNRITSTSRQAPQISCPFTVHFHHSERETACGAMLVVKRSSLFTLGARGLLVARTSALSRPPFPSEIAAWYSTYFFHANSFFAYFFYVDRRVIPRLQSAFSA